VIKKQDQGKSSVTWLEEAEALLCQGSTDGASMATAHAVIALAYEQRRTNELLSQLTSLNPW
jgi:hypothetical protein